MAARFARNADIRAGLPPLRTVRRNPTPARAALREEMREFMEKRPLDFSFTVRNEAGI